MSLCTSDYMLCLCEPVITARSPLPLGKATTGEASVLVHFLEGGWIKLRRVLKTYFLHPLQAKMTIYVSYLIEPY